MDDKKLILAEFEKLLKKAKRKADIAQQAESELYKMLDDMGIDAQEIETSAENADNLHQAISCYLSYGEYNIKGIVKELGGAIERED